MPGASLERKAHAMTDDVRARLTAFFELANEAAAVADLVPDGLLSSLAAAAALGAADRLGIPPERVTRLRQDLRKRHGADREPTDDPTNDDPAVKAALPATPRGHGAGRRSSRVAAKGRKRPSGGFASASAVARRP